MKKLLFALAFLAMLALCSVVCLANYDKIYRMDELPLPPNELIIQFVNGTTTIGTVAGGIAKIACDGTTTTCTYSGGKFTISSAGSTPGSGNTVQYQNRSAGTLLNGLASLVAPVSGGIVEATPAGATGLAIGIVTSGAGTSGIATIQTSGVALCVFDNSPTTAYYAVISSTVNGNCHAVATYPTSSQVIGRVQDGTGNVLLYPEVQAPPTTGLVGSGGSPAMGLYFSSLCPVANTGQCFFTPANTQVDQTATWSSASGSVAITDGLFTAADVGKRVAGYVVTTGASPTGGCIADRVAFSELTTGTVTIATFVDSNHVTLSSNPSNTATGTGCFIWGTSDDTTASTFETAYAAITAYCPRIMLAAANYWFSSPHFYSQPSGCLPLPSLSAGAQSSLGNLLLPQGVELEGRGPGATQIYLGPDFPHGDSCAHTSGSSPGGCFAIPVEGKWTDFGISGGGQSVCQVSGGVNLIVAAVATLQNITLTNMCFGVSGNQRTGIYADQLTQFYQVNDSGFGEQCVTVDSTGAVQAFKLFCENNPLGSLLVNGTAGTVAYQFQCWGCVFTGAAEAWTAGSFEIAVGANSVVRLHGTYITPAPVTGYISTTGTNLIRNEGGTLYCDNCAENISAANGQAVSGLVDSASGAINYFSDSTLNGAGGGSAYNSQGFGTFYDLGGNIINAATVAFQPGVLVADGRMLSGACTGTATASSTLGLYSTLWNPTVTTTTCTTTTVGAGYAMTQARTLSTLQVTATHAGVSASSGVVTVMKNGSTTTLTCTVGTGTSCNDFTHTVSVVAGDLIAIRFTTQGSEVLAGVKASVAWQ